MCQLFGADTFCDYEQLLLAESKGEFSQIPEGTTAWVHRTTTALVDGVSSLPGTGGRCVDWTYDSNHVADGEYVVFGAGGVPTYHLDSDTFYDGVDLSHTASGDLDCGGEVRALLCCSAP